MTASANDGKLSPWYQSRTLWLGTGSLGLVQLVEQLTPLDPLMKKLIVAVAIAVIFVRGMEHAAASIAQALKRKDV